MSKTWRKHGGMKDSMKGAKRVANQKVRRTPDIPDGNAYRKVTQQWDICDWNCTHPLSYEKYKLHHPDPPTYPEGGFWRAIYKEVYFPPARLYYNADGHRRWRLKAGFVLPKGWDFNSETCEYIQTDRYWNSRRSAQFGFYTHIFTGKYRWVEESELSQKWRDRDERWNERETRNYRYSVKFPRYGRRDRKRARNMKRSSGFPGGLF